MKLRNVLAAALLMVAACGGDDVNDVEPRLIPGGGSGDGAIAGEVNIHVIDSATGDPVGSANIYVGEPGETLKEGITDSGGLFVLEDEGLDGATTVTVTATGYSPVTWFGANAANLTIPIDPTSSSAIPQAELSGTIAGWDSLPAPATGHLLIASVGYSQSAEIGDDANNLPPPPSGTMIPSNACYKVALMSQCSWRLNSRTGAVALYAAIIDVDTKGNTDSSDDTYEVIGFAYKDGVTVNDGVDQSGLSLDQLAVGALTDVSLTLEASPSGLTNSFAIFRLDTGTSGLLNVGVAANDNIGTHTVPKLEGPFASASYSVLAITDDGSDDQDPPSSAILNDLDGLPSSVSMGPWLDGATDLSASGGTFSYTPVSGTSLHVVNFYNSAGEDVWGAALLDGRTSFTLPGIPTASLPSGELAMSILEWEGDIDVSNFEIDTLLQVVTRFSSARITFTN
jgi:hypothetical protein